MNILEEKQYIYEMMKDITSERRKLVEIYWDLKKRLDFLNSLEERGLEELSLEGYIDLHNKINKEIAVENIKRESSYIIEEIEKPKKEKNEVEKATELQKDYSARKRKGKTSYINRDKVISTLTSILKEEGAPIKVKELYNKVNAVIDGDLKYANFQNNIVPKAMEKNKKIERITKGFYQYRF
jgi:phosphosulfolactate synthase (CoM biosynthesis protein A)